MTTIARVDHPRNINFFLVYVQTDRVTLNESAISETNCFRAGFRGDENIRFNEVNTFLYTHACK